MTKPMPGTTSMAYLDKIPSDVLCYWFLLGHDINLHPE